VRGQEAPGASLAPYIAEDRLRALLSGRALPRRTRGSALFADLSGFTALTERLRAVHGARKGGEELRKLLDAVYTRLIENVERYGGSVLGFSGDAITCWFEAGEGGDRAARRAASRALCSAKAMHEATSALSGEGATGPGIFRLEMKIAVASGRVSRLVAGDPGKRLLDEIAGRTVARMAAGELLASSGETLADKETLDLLSGEVEVGEWRSTADGGEVFGLVTGFPERRESRRRPLRGAVDEALLEPWILAPVWRREIAGQGAFLAEFRPCVALFLAFSGIDYDAKNAEARLDILVRRAQDIAGREGGDLLQITIGDKGSYAFLVFGATTAHENDARRAVSAALKLRDLTRDLVWLEAPRCGVSKGMLLVGTYGSPGRKAFSVLGDDVNIAARLMQAASPGEILVAGRVHFAVMRDFECGPETLFSLKGKAGTIPAYSVLGDRRMTTLGLLEPGYSLPVAGREKELATLASIIDETLAGRGQVLRISGEAGLGKSRLLAETVAFARARGFACHGGACQSSGGRSSWLPWKPVFATLFGVDPEAPPDKRLALLAAFIDEVLPSKREFLPLLAPLFDLEAGDTDTTRGLGPEGRLSGLVKLLKELIPLLAVKQPLMLMIEDLHWIDELSLDFLAEIASLAPALPVLLAMATRPPGGEAAAGSEAAGLARLEALSGEPWFTELRLEELGAEASRALAAARWKSLFGDSKGAPEEVLAFIAERSQGNPFYIEEVLNFLRDEGVDPEAEDILAAVELPESVQSLVLSRIDRLTEAEKVTLKVASVIGRKFRASWLPGYYPEVGEERTVRERLETLESLGLTPLDRPEPELTYLFKHIVTHDVAYESLPYETRSQLHARLGAYLERAFPDAPPLDALAFHYARSGDTAKKRRYLKLAGDAARERFANQAALEYYGLLLPLLDAKEELVDLLLLRADVLDTIGRGGEAETDYRRALAEAVTAGYLAGRGKAAQGIGAMVGLRGEYEAAFGFFESSERAFAEAGDESGRAGVLNDLGLFSARRGDFPAATSWLEKALDASRRSGNRTAESAALNYLGTVAHAQGDFPRARLRLGESLAIKRELGERFRIANSVNNLGVVAMDQGEYAEAREYLEESLALRRSMGEKSGIAGSLGNLAIIELHLGERAKAGALARESLDLLREIGETGSEGTVLGILGGIANAEGDFAGAEDRFRECLALQSRVPDPQAAAPALAGLALAAAETGRPARAALLAGAAEALRASSGFVFDSLVAKDRDRAASLAALALGPSVYEALSARALTLDLDAAVAEGLSNEN
jgi:class 3 adenylate cyclase/tetratricopeptide (TPR) repeat protein